MEKGKKMFFVVACSRINLAAPNFTRALTVVIFEAKICQKIMGVLEL